MKALAAFAGLEGLFDLAEGNGVDMCATLLRVLTDLYLQRPIHTPEDEHYYTELALRLIDATEVSERAALAARLASYPSAPQPVLERLARDVVEVAGRSSSVRHGWGPPRSRRSPKQAVALMGRALRRLLAVRRKPRKRLLLSTSPKRPSCPNCSTRRKRPSAD